MIRQIPVQALRVGMYIDKLEVFWLKHPSLTNQMLITSDEQIRTIFESGLKTVWIDAEKSVVPPDIIDQIIPANSTTGETAVKLDSEIVKAQQVCDNAKEVIRSLFESARMGLGIDTSLTVPVVDDITTSIRRHPTALLSISRLKNHDDYTYQHSVAVCALMVSLARQLQFDEKLVQLAGMAGLVHDIGKAQIPAEILNKPGRLTESEFLVIKQHPVTGAEMLKGTVSDINLLDVVLHHHEKVDGSGYPDGLDDIAISQLSKMAAVCDVYDAITSERPYKAGWNPAWAMHKMANWKGHFDQDVFYAFVKTVGIYPAGSLVRLASGRIAVVTEPSEGSLLRPKVCVFFSSTSNQKIPAEIVDLSEPTCWDSIRTRGVEYLAQIYA
ncbi:MAG: Cyclic di-GMP phosphodiesterase [Candidatus Erwinia impunctatus]|nr:Cyclic di-GMP phosphodiesterase [Culicoides impunctatus]